MDQAVTILFEWHLVIYLFVVSFVCFWLVELKTESNLKEMNVHSQFTSFLSFQSLTKAHR